MNLILTAGFVKL